MNDISPGENVRLKKESLMKDISPGKRVNVPAQCAGFRARGKGLLSVPASNHPVLSFILDVCRSSSPLVADG